MVSSDSSVVGPQRFCNGDISNRPRVPGYDKSLEQPNTQTQQHIYTRINGKRNILADSSANLKTIRYTSNKQEFWDAIFMSNG